MSGKRAGAARSLKPQTTLIELNLVDVEEPNVSRAMENCLSLRAPLRGPRPLPHYRGPLSNGRDNFFEFLIAKVASGSLYTPVVGEAAAGENQCWGGCTAMLCRPTARTTSVAVLEAFVAASSCAPPIRIQFRRPANLEPPHTSKFATFSAFAWMNSRRGSTTSPISLTKMSSASSTSLIFTCNRERAFAVERRLPELVLVHLAEALVALQGHALAPGGVDGVEHSVGPATWISSPRRDESRRSLIGFAAASVHARRAGAPPPKRAGPRRARRLTHAAHFARRTGTAGLDRPHQPRSVRRRSHHAPRRLPAAARPRVDVGQRAAARPQSRPARPPRGRSANAIAAACCARARASSTSAADPPRRAARRWQAQHRAFEPLADEIVLAAPARPSDIARTGRA